MYKILRSNLTQNWIDLLSKICEDYNNTPNKKLGWLKPNDINTIYDSAKVLKAKKELGIKTYHEPSYKEQNLNQKLYESNKKNIQVGTYVYVDFDEKLFDKSFDIQV